MNLKKWIFAIISIIILLIITLVILLTLPKRGQTQEQDEGRQDGAKEIVIEYESLVKVKDRNTFFTVASCIDKYLIEVVSQDAQNIYDLLSTDYIVHNEITVDNVLSKIESYEIPQIFSAKVMYELNYTDSLSTYYVEGTIRDDIFSEQEAKEKVIQLAVQLDKVNRTYTILPNEKVPSSDAIPKITTSSIEPKGQNTYYSVNMLDTQMANMYLKEFAKLLKTDIREAYNKLQEEYKQKRFPTQSSLEQYVKLKKDYVLEPQAKSVSVSNTDQETIYTIRDYYGNRYIIKEKAVLDYTIELDDYTIENTDFIEAYQQANNRDKGLLNLDRFFEMLNMQDFESAYNLLDSNFKQNQFKTLETFENYIKTNLFTQNNVSYTEYNSQIQGLHTYKAIVTDATEQNEKQVTLSLVVKLLEGTDFVMSFSIIN